MNEAYEPFVRGTASAGKDAAIMYQKTINYGEIKGMIKEARNVQGVRIQKFIEAGMVTAWAPNGDTMFKAIESDINVWDLWYSEDYYEKDRTAPELLAPLRFP